MTIKNSLKNWGDNHFHNWIDGVRIFFGFLLMIQGLYYIEASDFVILWWHGGATAKDFAAVLAVLLAFLHIFLGLLILIGVATRLSCFVLLPVIILSIVYTNPHLIYKWQLLFSILAFIGCIIFLIEGSGKFSVFALFSNKRKSPENQATSTHNSEKA